MIVWLSASGACGPKFMVPRHRRLTTRPRRPTCVYSMGRKFTGARRVAQAAASEPSRSGSRAPGMNMNPIVTAAAQQPRPDQGGLRAERGRERPHDRERDGHAADRHHPVQAGDAPEEVRRDEPLQQRHPHHHEDRDRPLGDERHDHGLPDGVRPRRTRSSSTSRAPTNRYRIVSGLPRQPAALSDHRRGEHRPHAAGAEHQAQIDRRAVSVVLHDERHQRLPRPPRAQQADERADQRRPQPGALLDVPDALLRVGPERGVVLRVSLRGACVRSA